MKKKRGRPKFVIDYDLVEKLANIFCTEEDIAKVLGCSVDTLQRDPNFRGIYKKGLSTAKNSLRMMQFKLAQTNAAMAIFLGKQHLGQKDVIETNSNVEGKINIKIIGVAGDDKHRTP